MKDRKIVAAIVAGDPAGLAGAYDKYVESLYGYRGWMLGGPGRCHHPGHIDHRRR